MGEGGIALYERRKEARSSGRMVCELSAVIVQVLADVTSLWDPNCWETKKLS